MEEMANTGQDTPENMIRRCLKRTAERLMPNGDVAPSFDDAGSSSIPSPSPPAMASESHPMMVTPIPQPIVDEITHFQARRLDQILKTEFGLPLGLADKRVAVLGIGVGEYDYTGAALKIIVENLANHDFAEGLSLAIEATARIWNGDASHSGIMAPCCLQKEEIERVYRKTWERRRNFFDADSRVPSFAQGEGRPILAALGLTLPALDRADQELFNNELRLAMFIAPPAGGRQGEGMQSRFLLRGPRSPDEYWKAYTEYLKKRPHTAHAEPVDPARYGELLEYRQKARDTRIQCLQSYTGVRRVNAGKDDILAGPQALLFRFVELMIQEAGTGAAVMAVDTPFISHSGTTGMRKSLVASCNHILVDEIADLAYNASAPINSTTTPKTESLSILALCSRPKALPMGKAGRAVLHRRYDDREAMLASLKPDPDAGEYKQLFPKENNGYLLLPAKTSREYLSWPSLKDISAEPPLSGLMEKRGGALVDIDRTRLENGIRRYFDKTVPWSELAFPENSLATTLARYRPKATRETALESSGFDTTAVKPYAVKPFDIRWCYYSTVKSLWSDPKPRFAALCEGGNQFIATRADKVVSDEGVPFFFTTFMADGDLLRGHSYYFPMWRLDDRGNRAANLSKHMLDYLTALGVLPDTPVLQAASMVWNHVLAIAFSSAYLNGNADGIGQEWPRIPFPAMRGGNADMREKAKAVFMESVRLGKAVAELLDPGVDVDGVTRGIIRPELQCMAVLWDVGCNVPFPEGEPSEISLTAGWGKLSEDRSGNKSAKAEKLKRTVLPARGKSQSRDFGSDEKHFLETGALAVGVHIGGTYACLGDETLDIHLNENILVRNIPANVWRFTVGGYQVLRKWLSYRETSILGRPLSRSEVDVFVHTVRRIAALLLLAPRLNHNYAVSRDLHKASNG